MERPEAPARRSRPSGHRTSGGSMEFGPKNRLQERAQKEHVDPPAYTATQTGPQHAPRFKATVRFDGAEFHSPDDGGNGKRGGGYPTLKQAELAAARVALQELGPSRALPEASPLVLDEESKYKNLLQELTQKAGVALPKYTTTQSGPPHQPLFTCTVEVPAALRIRGQHALTRKNAEKNAAMAAWSFIKENASEGRGNLEVSVVTEGSETNHRSTGTEF